MTHRRRWAAGLMLLSLATAACTASFTASNRPASPAPSQEPSPSPAPSGPGSAAAAMRALCVPPTPTGGERAEAEATTPPAIADVERQVQTVRGLSWRRPVAVDPVTRARIASKLTRAFDATYPRAYYARRTLAWRVLGVIPAGADLRRSLLRFQTGQVIGYYDPDTGRLVYVGSPDPSFEERFTLAHELTHAMDDQHFDLSRLDPLADHCQDERFQAALGAVEGSAQYFAYRTVLRYPGSDVPAVGGGAGGSLAGVPPFLVAMELWPYTAGQEFMTAMDARGGISAIDGALRRLPASTEQVMHPERYPYDVPTPVNVPDLAPTLGPGWRDLDVMQVGEEFLNAMLALRLDPGTAAAAAAGWDGGLYRAWTDGAGVASVVSTVWDTTGDARAFAQAARDWLGGGDTVGAVLADHGTRVVLGFASDAAVLSSLRSAEVA
jgi:hypothetical protein